MCIIIVFDAFGKPTSGILKGGIQWIGDYRECIGIKEEEWNGKYCLLTASVSHHKYYVYSKANLKYIIIRLLNMDCVYLKHVLIKILFQY